MFPFKKIFNSLLIGLIVGGLFSATLYAFATYGVDEYFPLGNTLTPTCTPGDTYCKVVSPAFFSFGSNNFSGTGGFTTTGAIGGGAITGTSFVIGANTISSFANLSSIAGLATTVGLVKQTSANTFGIDTTAYYKSGDAITTSNLTDSGLTITRVPYASTAGLLVDSANLTFDGTTLTAGGFATASSSTGVTVSGALGVLTLAGVGNTNNENLTFDFETTPNSVAIGTGTGVTGLNFNALNLSTTGTIGGGAITGTSFVIGANTISSFANLSSIAGLANSAGWLHNNGSGTFAYSTPSATDVGLGNVTNNAQINASLGTNVGDLITFSAASTPARVADVAAGSYLRSGGVNTVPLWSTLILPNAGTAYKLSAYTATNTLGELAAVGGTGTILTGVTGAIPAWTTATYPATTTANQLLYSTATNVIGGNAGLTFNGNTLEVTSTSAAQAKLTNDSSNYATLTTGTTGDLTIATATGTTGGDIILNPASNASNSMLSASGILILGGYGGTYNENLKFDFETTANTVALSSTTGATSVNFGSLNLVSAGTLTLGGSTAGTLVTRVKAGAPDEADADGSVVIDSSDARIYFRYGGAWHYAAQTAGFQIPDFETIDPISGDQIAEGDIVLGMINKTMSDNALHGVWVKWESVKAELLAEARGELAESGTLGDGTVSGVGTETLLDKVTNVLFSLGISVKDGITSIKQLVSEKITTNTLEIKQMQMVDKATGEIYCAWIENGLLKNVKGECSSIDVAVAVVEQEQQQQETIDQVVQDTTQEVVQQASEQITEQIQQQVQEEVQQQVGDQVQQQIQEEVADQIKKQEEKISDKIDKEAEKELEKEIKQETKKEPAQSPAGNEAGEIAVPSSDDSARNDETDNSSLDSSLRGDPQGDEAIPNPVEVPVIEEPAPTIGDVVTELTASLLNSMSKFFKETFILGLKKISSFSFIEKTFKEVEIGLTVTTPMLIEKSSTGLLNSFQEISSAFQDLWTKVGKLVNK